nr:unnamed protein product [Digitaria exilis]
MDKNPLDPWFLSLIVAPICPTTPLSPLFLCSRREDDKGCDGVGQGIMAVHVLAPLDRKDVVVPKVLDIMAGYNAPSFLASAVPLNKTQHQGVGVAGMPLPPSS